MLYTRSRWFSRFNVYNRRRRRRPQALDLLAGLQAHWKLEEASDTRYDSAQEHHLTPHGMVLQAEGKTGYGAEFIPATSAYLSCPSSPGLRLGGGDFTIAGWVFFNALLEAGLVGKWETGSLEYLVACNGSQLCLRVSPEGSNPAEVCTSAGLESGLWYFFSAWHDSAAGTLNIALNNQSPSTLSYGAGVCAGDAEFNLGRDALAGLGLAGRLDAVSLWNRVLNTGERARLYNAGNGLEYPF